MYQSSFPQIQFVVMASFLILIGNGCDDKDSEHDDGGEMVSSSHAIEVRVMNLNGVQACFNEGEIWVELFDDKQSYLAGKARHGHGREEHPRVGGELFRFPVENTGVYWVQATACVQSETDGRISLGPVFCDTGTRPEDELAGMGFAIGASGRDALGEYRIVELWPETRLPHGSEPGRLVLTGAHIRKRYQHVRLPVWVMTHVAEDEQLDRVLAVMSTPIDDKVFEAMGKSASSQMISAVLKSSAGGDKLGASLRNGAFATLLLTAVTDFDHLFTVDTALTLGAGALTTVLLGPGVAGSAVMLAVGVLPPVIVGEAGKEQLQTHAFSDDFVAEAHGSLEKKANRGEGMVNVRNFGEPLYEVEVMAQLSDGMKEWMPVSRKTTALTASQSETLSWSVDSQDVRRNGQHSKLTGHLALFYETEPVPGLRTLHKKELFVSSESPRGDEEESTIEIISVRRSTGRGIFSQVLPKVVVEIRNNSGKPVDLFINSVSGEKYGREQLAWERENTPGFKMPYGLGCEVQRNNNGQWEAPFTSYAWVPQERASAKSYEVTREITITSQSTVSCSLLLTESPTGVRVFLLDPNLKRIDERAASFLP